MCGILGASYKEGVDLDVFERQLAKITHRGSRLFGYLAK
jgi:asparagine synthetase B (glutamine-hydrolysing)